MILLICNSSLRITRKYNLTEEDFDYLWKLAPTVMKESKTDEEVITYMLSKIKLH